ncbi:MAG: LeuA family protein [Peptococcaceae bacterium]|nr:LeuA family protein [Peptococcaceae bacterium]
MDGLFHNWNTSFSNTRGWHIVDDTLRDGLQAPNITAPALTEKLMLIDCMVKNGVYSLIASYPAASKDLFDETDAMLRHIRNHNYSIVPSLAGRTTPRDLRPIVELQQRFGRQLRAYAFIACSPIRQSVENWDMGFIRERIEESLKYLISEDVFPIIVIEDSTRCNPGDLSEVLRCAAGSGAKSVTLADTVGCINSEGVRKLVGFARGITGSRVTLEWHGHNDRGLALANALTAIDCGVEYVHTTASGIGERTGNLSFEQLLVNLWLDGCDGVNLSFIHEFAALTARYTHMPIPPNQPVIGSDIFTTGTGVHASAILKALKNSDAALADAVYSSIPARLLGRAQNIEIGQMSGRANVEAKLRQMGLPYTDEMAETILAAAKSSSRFLTDAEITRLADVNES